LPWRHTQDPYKIWLSEIILQQTRVAQGTSYYYKFIEKYKDVNALADANLDEVLLLWQGLGYYSRARNLHKAAKEIQQNYSGNFPKTYNEIIALKGIGEYTASAISSFAFNLPHAVVDGNVFRVLARYYGIDMPINTGAAKKYFTELANEILDKKNAAAHNQAIMEFGALQCTPTNPNCKNCCLALSCVALKNDEVSLLPVKEKKLKIKTRFFNYFIVYEEEFVYIKQRGANDIWEGLFEFPLIETETSIDELKLLETKQFTTIFGDEKFELLSVSANIKHVLTHRIILCKFYQIKFLKESPKKHSTVYLKIRFTDLENYALPRLIDRFIKQDIKQTNLYAGQYLF